MTISYATVIFVEILRWKQIAGKAAFHAARDGKTRARPLTLHGHDFAEIFWIDAGQGTHRINGAAVPLRTGSLVLMRPSDCHGIDPIGHEELKLTNVAFPAETLAELQPRYGSLLSWPFAEIGKLPFTRQIEPFQRQRFNQWADELSSSPRERLFLDRFLLNVLAELRREPQEATLAGAPSWLAAACRAIQSPEHFCGGVEEFLRRCGRSREHVARSVQLYFHRSPTDYVNDVRMAYARRQLEMGDQSILDIALECGTPNLSHFYRLFRERTPMTPRAYRLTHRKPV